VKTDDVRVIQGRGQVGFAIESLAKLVAGRQIGGQHLQGFAPWQPWVLDEIHLAHPPGTQ
jgi:hypothetical protein